MDERSDSTSHRDGVKKNTHAGPLVGEMEAARGAYWRSTGVSREERDLGLRMVLADSTYADLTAMKREPRLSSQLKPPTNTDGLRSTISLVAAWVCPLLVGVVLWSINTSGQANHFVYYMMRTVLVLLAFGLLASAGHLRTRGTGKRTPTSTVAQGSTPVTKWTAQAAMARARSHPGSQTKISHQDVDKRAHSARIPTLETMKITALPLIGAVLLPWLWWKVALVPGWAAVACWALMTGAAVLLGAGFQLADALVTGDRHSGAFELPEKAHQMILNHAVIGTPGSNLSGETTFTDINVAKGQIGELRTAGDLNLFTLNPAVRVLHSVRFPGSLHNADVDHLVILGSKAAIVDSKFWRPERYTLVDDQTVAIGNTGKSHSTAMTDAALKVNALGELSPLQLECRAFVVVHSSGTDDVTVGNFDEQSLTTLVQADTYMQDIAEWLTAQPANDLTVTNDVVATFLLDNVTAI